MTDVVDLSNLRKPAPKPDSPSLDDLGPEDQEALNKHVENNPDAGAMRARTAFLVVVENDGKTAVAHDLSIPLVLDHPPTTDEIYAAISLVANDIQVQLSASYTVALMQQTVAAQQQAMANSQIASQLNLRK